MLMSEVEKMYELAQPEKRCDTYGTFRQCPHKTWKCEECTSFVYRPFTAEKQIEIVKMILFSTWWMNLKRLQFAEKFDEGLAQIINELWQSLTEEEKQQVKGILE